MQNYNILILVDYLQPYVQQKASFILFRGKQRWGKRLTQMENFPRL